MLVLSGAIFFKYLPFDVNVRHFVSGKECIVFENDLVCVPDDDSKLVGGWLAGRHVGRQSWQLQKETQKCIDTLP